MTSPMIDPLRFILVALCVLGAACASAAGEVDQRPSASACFVRTTITPDDGTQSPVPVQLEIADTAEARTTGLMHRQHLAANAGMLFVFPGRRSGDSGFWMYNTLIPLDIAFLDEDGYIDRILSMVPCPHAHPLRCPSYRPGVSYRQAVETNAGFFVRHQLREGDRLLLGNACLAEPQP